MGAQAQARGHLGEVCSACKFVMLGEVEEDIASFATHT